jgi:hypothetical protein
VFAPLGMKTARVISEADTVPDRPAGYRLVDGALENPESSAFRVVLALAPDGRIAALSFQPR